MIMLYRYRLKARYHKSGEKSRHFSYPDYLVCHDQPYGQRGPDNGFHCNYKHDLFIDLGGITFNQDKSVELHTTTFR